jgi:hypothetical protein
MVKRSYCIILLFPIKNQGLLTVMRDGLVSVMGDGLLSVRGDGLLSVIQYVLRGGLL